MQRNAVELYEGLLTTRSMHRFTTEPVSDHDVWEVLRAAQQAPTAGHPVTTQYVVVTDPGRRSALAAVNLRAYDRYEAAMLAQAPLRQGEDQASFERSVAAARHLAEHLAAVPVLIAVTTEDVPRGIADGDGVMDIGTPLMPVFMGVQNLLLAARSRGLGTSLSTVFRIHHDEMRQLLAVPTSRQVVALIALGHVDGRFVRARRRPIETVTHWNSWGDQRLAT